ncbi:MAG: hypothetical protein AAF657_03500 [Acidobacteriota bacterium]
MTVDDAFDPAYLVTLDEIYHCYWAARKKRQIKRLRTAVEHFWPNGHPTRFVHISGTNGKGSVAHYLEQGLRCSGPTGSWTGPHVFDYAERLHINAEQAPRDAIVEIYRDHLEPYQGSLTEGETLGFPELGILLALHLFDQNNAVWGLMESGVGGRYTPLMALNASAGIVTNVGGDHPLSLGQELWQRALEKAGIARPGVPFFTAATGDALDFVSKTAVSQGAPVEAVDEPDRAQVRRGLEGSGHSTELLGPEVDNLALALKVVQHFYPEEPPEALLSAMSARLPGRFWTPEPGVIVDVAHNREKIAHFVARLKLHHPEQRFRFLIGLTRQRDPIEMFEPLFEVAETITVTSASYPGREPSQIASQLRRAFQPVAVQDDAREAYRSELAARRDGQTLALTGSAYMIDQALNPNPYVRHLNASFGWRGRIGDRV